MYSILPEQCYSFRLTARVVHAEPLQEYLEAVPQCMIDGSLKEYLLPTLPCGEMAA